MPPPDLDELKMIAHGRKVLFVIPCCKDKKFGGGLSMPAPQAQGLDGYLSGRHKVILFHGRRGASHSAGGGINSLGSTFGVPHPSAAEYLHAYDRYQGILYCVPGVLPLLKAPSEASITIMSALYGLLMPHDLIQYYDLEMRGPTIGIWRNGLPNIINECSKSIESNLIIGLFGRTTGYNTVFSGLGTIPGCDAYAVHTNGRGARHILQGLGHALVYLAAKHASSPLGYDYTIRKVR